MPDHKYTYELTYRDGTSQKSRYLAAINPDYIPLDERSVKDLLLFVKSYAKEIRYFSEQNQVDGDWASFLDLDLDQMVEFIHRPETFKDNQEKLDTFSQPHRVLFLTFIQLLQHAQTQLNTLTQRHLDFFYVEALKLQRRTAEPDQVNVLVSLSDNTAPYLLPKGTLLDGGKDSEDGDLRYQTDGPLIVNNGEVSSLKSIFVDKQVVGLKEAHQIFSQEPDDGFSKLMEHGLGDPNPGDELSPFPPQQNSLDQILANAQNQGGTRKIAAEAYIKEKLFLTGVNDLKQIIDIRDKEKATEEEWEAIYTLLASAYGRKVFTQRRATFQQVRESLGEYSLLALALGDSELENENSSSRAQLTQFFQDSHDPQTLTQVHDFWHLNEADFNSLKAAINNPSGTSTQGWDKIYKLLQLAERDRLNLGTPNPISEEWFNIYQSEDATQISNKLDFETGKESLRWKTFGAISSPIHPQITSAEIGFSISSPILFLQEGNRLIDLFLDFEKESFSLVEITKILKPNPFSIHLSTTEGWINISDDKISLAAGVMINQDPEDVFSLGNISSDGKVFTKQGGRNFTVEDVGMYISFNGDVYQVQAVQSMNAAEVIRIYEKVLPPPSQPEKYSPQSIYFHGIHVQVSLDPTIEAIVASDSSNSKLSSSWPVMKILLKELIGIRGKKINRYHELKSLHITAASLRVDVKNILDLQLQNDDGVLKAKTPFEPFGNQPQVGNSFYFAHPEICFKKLSSLNIELDWMGVPDDLSKHYALYGSGTGIANNASFQAQIRFHDNRAVLDVDTLQLFYAEGVENKTGGEKTQKHSLNNFAAQIQEKHQGYIYERDNRIHQEEDLLETRRFFQLELNNPDFQHTRYPNAAAQKSIELARDLTNAPGSVVPENYQVPPPYTPKVKQIRLNYTSSVALDPDQDNGIDRLSHVHPFGYSEVQLEQPTPDKQFYPLLPVYENQGFLYIGIANLQTPQNLSLLFQMAEGSANPDIEKPEVHWSFLNGDRWVQFVDGGILQDTTNALVNTGIIVFDLPKEAGTKHQLLPSGFHWLRVMMYQNTESVCDVIAIQAQAVSATLVAQSVSSNHFGKPLPAKTISQLIERHSEIAEVQQPYTSGKGRAAETDLSFYTRVSERIRHKNRALTLWDYERLILERFPEIYKTKCLPTDMQAQEAEAGQVEMIVVPDIRNKLPFNPFEPKVPADVLVEAEAFINEISPVFATVNVKNPIYVQVKTRFAVRFREGYNSGYAKGKLNEELREFLAPWAYDRGADIVIGGKIYAGVIINFIEERPYVDYVAGMKLFQSVDGEHFTYVPPDPSEGNVITVHRPDAILVSALQHEIDLITEKRFDEEDFEGINYMAVELDFVVE